jgi:hypothetical protein
VLTPAHLKRKVKLAPVAHTFNPSYSGGRDQEDHSLKLSRANSLQDPVSKKKTFHKKGMVEWLKV